MNAHEALILTLVVAVVAIVVVTMALFGEFI
jgi:hypothetical protein